MRDLLKKTSRDLLTRGMSPLSTKYYTWSTIGICILFIGCLACTLRGVVQTGTRVVVGVDATQKYVSRATRLHISVYIAFYDEYANLKQVLQSVTESPEVHIQLRILNNNKPATLPKIRGILRSHAMCSDVDVLQICLLPGGCPPFLSRTWNTAILAGFHGNVRQKNKYVVTMQGDIRLKPTWLRDTLAARAHCGAMLQWGKGDEFIAYFNESLFFDVGPWDESFNSARLQEADFFYRAVANPRWGGEVCLHDDTHGRNWRSLPKELTVLENAGPGEHSKQTNMDLATIIWRRKWGSLGRKWSLFDDTRPESTIWLAKPCVSDIEHYPWFFGSTWVQQSATKTWNCIKSHAYASSDDGSLPNRAELTNDASLRGAAWRIEGSTLLTEVTVSTVFSQKGAIKLPMGGVSEIWLDIGINMSPKLPHGRTWEDLPTKKALYLGFEALLDKYAHHISLDLSHNLFRPIGSVGSAPQGSSDRALIFPIAISSTRPSALLDFHVTKVDGCSSINSPRSSDELTKNWSSFSPVLKDLAASCTQVEEVRKVPWITLKEVITNWLREIRAHGAVVEYAHIDAQGAEMEILRSAGEHVRTIQRIQLEVPNPKCSTLTRGASTCKELLEEMNSFGFQATAAHWYDRGLIEFTGPLRNCDDLDFHGFCEYDLVFTQNNISAALS